jgi:hypothetical protein
VKLLLFALALAVAPPVPAPTKPAPPPPAPPPSRDVLVKTSLDRTAVWVGDHVTYTIELTCKPGFDVLDEDLSKDHLKLDGLDVVATDVSQQERPDGGRLHEYRYTLTTLHVDQAALKIAPLSVRYFASRPGQRLQEATAAGEVAVPGATIAFRSMLPEAQESYDIRSARGTTVPPRAFAHAEAIGSALVIVSLAPAGFWLVGLVRGRERVVKRSAREVRQQEKASIDAAQLLDLSTPEGRRDAYGQMNTIVRDHLRDVCGVAGPALTPSEIEAALGRSGSRVAAEDVVSLLGACDIARYAPLSALPPADACRDALERTAQLVAAR